MRRSAALACLVLSIAACGDGERKGSDRDRRVPAETLAELRREAASNAEGEEGAPLLAAIDAVAKDGGRGSGRARQVVLSAWITYAIERGRVEEAEAAYGSLAAEFDGAALTASGDPIPRREVAAGIAEAAVESARRRAEGSHPDLPGARRALEVATRLRGDAHDPDVERARLAAEAWIERTSLDLGRDVAPHDGPRVVALVDDFSVGEAPLPSVLDRWAEEGSGARLRVAALPILRGTIREGMRRVPAPTAREREHFSRAFEASGVGIEPGSMSDAQALSWGIPALEVGIVLVDAKGRIVARLSGTNPDLHLLDEAVQRVVGR